LNKGYDTYGDGGASSKLERALNKLPGGSVIAIAVRDEASKRLSRKVKQIISGMGSKEISRLRFREGWAFVGVKGMQLFGEKRVGKKGQASSVKAYGYAKITRKVRRGQSVKKIPGMKISVASAGFEAGNYATLKLGGSQVKI